MDDMSKYRVRCEAEHPVNSNVSERAKEHAFRCAWENGHLSGLSEVLSHYGDFIDLAQIAADDVVSESEVLSDG